MVWNNRKGTWGLSYSFFLLNSLTHIIAHWVPNTEIASKYAHSELNHFNYKSRGNNLIHVCQEKRLKSPFVFSNKYLVTNTKLKLNKRRDV